MKTFFNLLFLLSLCLWGNEIEALCGECLGSNSIACHSKNTFSICLENGTVSDEIAECPPTFVCCDHMHICKPETDVMPSCNKETIDSASDGSECDICGPYQVFSCVAQNIIKFCFGQTSPSVNASTATCPEGSFCDLTNKNYCTYGTVSKPSCSRSEEEYNNLFNNGEGGNNSKAGVNGEEGNGENQEGNGEEEEELEITDREFPSDNDYSQAPTDGYKKFCNDRATADPYSNVYDPSCETYIYCFYQNNFWHGVELYCDDEYPYFDPATQKCVPNKPEKCP